MRYGWVQPYSSCRMLKIQAGFSLSPAGQNFISLLASPSKWSKMKNAWFLMERWRAQMQAWISSVSSSNERLDSPNGGHLWSLDNTNTRFVEGVWVPDKETLPVEVLGAGVTPLGQAWAEAPSRKSGLLLAWSCANCSLSCCILHTGHKNTNQRQGMQLDFY